MKEHSWVRTVVVQISLCFVLYLAFNLGQPSKQILDGTAQRRPLDVYFMSVVGGNRLLEEQILLLKQMAKAAKVFKAQFVVSIGEFGEDDPLIQNATEHFPSLKVPWYTTRSSKGQGPDHYLKQIKVPHGKTLDIIVLNTELFQGAGTVSSQHQLLWLRKALEESFSEWKIIVGFHPLSACNGSMETKDNPESLQHIFFSCGVNAYLSAHACPESVGRGDAEQLYKASEIDGVPYLTSANEMFFHNRERAGGFLLHRVSSLEFVTSLVNLKGEVVEKTVLHQRGREVM